MESQLSFIVRIATSNDHQYISEITDEMALSAAKRGVSVAPRTSEFIMEKMDRELSVIAINPVNGEWAGFCYIEAWSHGKYVANSGLIVSPKYRGLGVSRDIKIKIFEQCRFKFPDARHFSLTTSPAVIHVNHSLGYKITPFSELMSDALFSNGCNSWVNYMDLMQTTLPGHQYVAMTYTPLPVSEKQTVPVMVRYFLNRLKWMRKDKVSAPRLGMVGRDCALNSF